MNMIILSIAYYIDDNEGERLVIIGDDTSSGSKQEFEPEVERTVKK